MLADILFVKLCLFVFHRMLISRFWGRLRSVSTLISLSWTVRNSLQWRQHLRETGTIPLRLTRHLGSVCVTMICQFTTHLFHKTHTCANWNAAAHYKPTYTHTKKTYIQTNQLYCDLTCAHTLTNYNSVFLRLHNEHNCNDNVCQKCPYTISAFWKHFLTALKFWLWHVLEKGLLCKVIFISYKNQDTHSTTT